MSEKNLVPHSLFRFPLKTCQTDEVEICINRSLLSSSDLDHQLPPLILETDSELRMRIFKVRPVSSYRGFRYMAWTAPAPWLVTASLFWPLIGHKASHHPRPASLGGWGLVSQESNIRFMPQQQISMTLNFHHASSILAFLLFFVVYLDLNIGI